MAGVDLAEEAPGEEIAPLAGRELVDGTEDRAPGEGAEDVDARQILEEGPHLLLVGHVHLHPAGAAADAGHRLIEAVRAAVHQHQPRPVAGKALGDGQADPRGAARHHRDFPLQTTHGALRSRWLSYKVTRTVNPYCRGGPLTPANPLMVGTSKPTTL